MPNNVTTPTNGTIADEYSQDIAHPPNNRHTEGPVAKAIEQQTAKLPSDTFLWASLGSVALALGLEATGHREKANFVAHWAPTLLLFGVYNKLVKLHGSDGIRGEQEII